MRIKQLTQTDNFKISIKIKIKDAKCFHKRVYICGSLLCHLRAGSFFTISLLLAGFSSFEVLAYRWGIASLALVVFGIMLGETFRISRKDWGTVFILSLLRAATSFSLVIAYQT